jgi:hypothetical protein
MDAVRPCSLAYSQPGMWPNPRGTPAWVRIPTHGKIDVRLPPPKIDSRPETRSLTQPSLGTVPLLRWGGKIPPDATRHEG